MFSKTSVEKRGFVQKEFNLALKYCEEKLDSDIFIIPCRIDDCVIPEKFSKYQWVDLRESDALEKMLNALNYQRNLSDKPEENDNNTINNIEYESGFVIDSEYAIGGQKPLVLPVHTYFQHTIYNCQFISEQFFFFCSICAKSYRADSL